jgi:N4-gp56 family major capsid protein
MADTVFSVNSAETVKLWSKKLSVEALKKTYVGKFIGDSANSLIQEHKDLKKSAGDRLRYTLRTLLSGEGVQGDAILKGREESLATFTDDILIDQIRHAADAGGKMSQQRVLFNMRKECMDGLSDWASQRMDRWFFNQICGYTGTSVTEHGETYDGTRTLYTGNNAVLAPSANRRFWSEAGATADENLDNTGDNMALSLIDDIVTEAKLASPMIKPIKYQGENVYVMFLHPRQVRDLRTDAQTAGTWFDIQRARLEGGEGAKQNPIFNGSLGMYNNVVLHESSRVTRGVNSSTGAPIADVRRAAFCGAQAVALAFGQGDGFESWNWAEEKDDYGNKLGVAAGWIGGLKKTRFNNEDFGTIVLSTWAGA